MKLLFSIVIVLGGLALVAFAALLKTQLMVAGVVLLAIGVVGLVLAPQAAAKKYSGHAMAVMAEVHMTNVYINHMPVMSIALEYQDAYGRPVTTRLRTRVPYHLMGRMCPGDLLPIRYNPQKPGKAMITGLPNPQPAPQSGVWQSYAAPPPPPPPAPGEVQQPYTAQPPYAAQQPYPGQQPYAAQQPYPGQPPYTAQQPYPGQPPYTAQQPYPGQPPYAAQEPYPGQQPYAAQPSYPQPPAPTSTTPPG